MAVKSCCINDCNSSSARSEDIGVTYHKYPKDKTLRQTWLEVTRHNLDKESINYVCSRHFCKSDFQTYKDSKYILKPDAIPSIFPWTISKIIMESTKADEDNTESLNEDTEAPNPTYETDPESIETNKESVEKHDEQDSKDKDQKKECEIVTETDKTGESEIITDTAKVTQTEIVPEDTHKDLVTEAVEVKKDNDDQKPKSDDIQKEIQDETLAVASSVMDMILSESEAKICEKATNKSTIKRSLSSLDKGSVALMVGSRVEAKDFEESWHPAQIVEVDFDEMEVLVHYGDTAKKHDEWISVSSPRLRPAGSAPLPAPTTQVRETLSTSSTAESTAQSSTKEDDKVEKTEESKPKISFMMGERCLARWRDNRRFMATVSQDFGDGKYEIMFDDGAKWTCNVSRISKLKEPNKRGSLSVDTSGVNVSSCSPSPIHGSGVSNLEVPIVQIVPIATPNTHLFDPTRDYLGSKSERREMKRKLNIKEIFNIGQKKKKVEEPEVRKQRPKKVVKKTKVVKKKVKDEIVKGAGVLEGSSTTDAVASIIGAVAKEIAAENEAIKDDSDVKLEVVDPDMKVDVDDALDTISNDTLSAPESQEIKNEFDTGLDEEVKLEKFEQNEDVKHEEVIDRIKEAINKLEGGINKAETKLENEEQSEKDAAVVEPPDVKKKKIKRVKKERLLQEKKVKSEVERVKNELEDMKKQMEEMRRQMNEELARKQVQEMPESFLLPGEWCCKWVNGQPVGTVSELEQEPNNKVALPRRSVQVEDKRLPAGWTKHMVRRSYGNSAGKWDVVLMSPDNRRFHTKTDMRMFLESCPNNELKPFEHALMDFGIHLKLSRRMGWYSTTPDGENIAQVLPVGTLCATSPLVKRKQLSLKKEAKEKARRERHAKKTKERKKIKMKLSNGEYLYSKMPSSMKTTLDVSDEAFAGSSELLEQQLQEHPKLEDGCVYVGSLKVQIIENLLRCPAEGCYKNFRNNTLLKMHIKHYHRELRKMLGATPKVLDLAYARTRPTAQEMRRLKLEAQQKRMKIKLPKLTKKPLEFKTEQKDQEIKIETPTTPVSELERIPRSLDSPKLRLALNKPVKRPKVLLPVVRKFDDIEVKEETLIELKVEVPEIEPLDFEKAISTHTVTKPAEIKRKSDKKFASISKRVTSEDEEWLAMNSDVETRSSYPRSGTPDSKVDQKLVSSESNNEEQKDNNYMMTDTGERIKIVHMKREEIINCHCGFREEDGLMVQCELCLCWQHALCHNIQKESEVPEKYTCSICLNPRRGRRSQRFLHDQDRLYEGLLPGAKPCESLRRSHELSGNLHRIEDALHALRVKYHVATKKDHPKLYLWAKDWDTAELTMTQERLNSDYSDLTIMINNIGKENLPVRPDLQDMGLDMRTPPSEDPELDRFSQRDNQLGSQALLSGLLSSPGGASLELPISTSELERLAKTVQAETECRLGGGAGAGAGPQPEAAIENGACRERLLRHVQRCQALIDARLDSIEAQVAELESQDPSFEDDETADYFPRAKNTIRMLMRDLDTMEDLGLIT